MRRSNKMGVNQEASAVKGDLNPSFPIHVSVSMQVSLDLQYQFHKHKSVEKKWVGRQGKWRVGFGMHHRHQFHPLLRCPCANSSFSSPPASCQWSRVNYIKETSKETSTFLIGLLMTGTNTMAGQSLTEPRGWIEAKNRDRLLLEPLLPITTTFPPLTHSLSIHSILPSSLPIPCSLPHANWTDLGHLLSLSATIAISAAQCFYWWPSCTSQHHTFWETGKVTALPGHKEQLKQQF